METPTRTQALVEKILRTGGQPFRPGSLLTGTARDTHPDKRLLLAILTHLCSERFRVIKRLEQATRWSRSTYCLTPTGYALMGQSGQPSEAVIRGLSKALGYAIGGQASKIDMMFSEAYGNGAEPPVVDTRKPHTKAKTQKFGQVIDLSGTTILKANGSKVETQSLDGYTAVPTEVWDIVERIGEVTRLTGANKA